MDPTNHSNPPRSSFPNSVLRATTKIRLPSFLQRRKSNQPKRWKPPALHPATLIIATITPLALIVTLLLLLRRSQRDNGIIFAPDINALPLSKTFMYQYFPTVLAVVFSIFWAWIDLETKRLEPYYQLSQEEGALGKDSLLLAYPFGFLPLMPLKAFRQKHWSVFWASLTLVLVTWGLVPTQAGIFSTVHTTRNIPTSFDISTSSIPIQSQRTSLTLSFSQSAYGIVSLNETLPSFMARNYTLAPFRSSSRDRQEAEAGDTKEWTAPTTLYSLDLHCEPAIPFNKGGIRGWNNSGCVVTGGLSGNGTIVDEPDTVIGSSIKPFSAQYIGYWNAFGFADFYLSSSCPSEKNHTFFAAFTRNKEKDTDPIQNVTAIFCEPIYYSQEVNATVEMTNKQPVRVVPLGPKQPLMDTNNIFNTTWLEMIMNGGYPDNRVREDELPIATVPNFIEQVAETNLTLVNERQPLVGFSTFINERPLEDFLDWKTLARSYAESYRLLFARAMVDVLNDDFTNTEQIIGARMTAIDAVVLEPAFTGVVVGFLGVIVITTILLSYLTTTRALKLRSDPSTIGSVMGLVASSKALLRDFEDLDCCTPEELQQAIQQKSLSLVDRNNEVDLIEQRPVTNGIQSPSIFRPVSSKPIDKPVRPIEFSIWMSVLVIGVFVLLTIFLATVFIKARANGLPLPSQNTFVQNLLENYIPTAIATLIEPMWVLINRLLCLLQPIEELQALKAKAKDSIDLNYSSLPPQLVVFKALRARHFVLAAVCCMALLANILAIAFSGLFFHDIVPVLRTTNFEQPFDLRFVPINGSVGPSALRSFGTGTASGAYRGGNGRDQFLILGSNRSKGTPLPPWTDEKLFYLPFMTPDTSKPAGKDHFEAETSTLGVDLDCEVVDLSDMRRKGDSTGVLEPVLNKTVRTESIQAKCSSNTDLQVIDGPSLDSTVMERVCQNGASALELVAHLEALDPNATQEEKELCWRTVILGWARKPEGSCTSSNLTTLDAENSFFLQCQPRLTHGRALVRVDTNGRLVKKAQVTMPQQMLGTAESKAMFESSPSDLIAQSNRYIFTAGSQPWHNDSFPTDFLNYFMAEISNNSWFLDPHQSVPTWQEIQAPLRETYESLFAIWLGGNKEHLLVSHTGTKNVTNIGSTVVEEERLFLSTPLFAIAEGILFTYVLAACLVYFRRPGKYLPRLPTNLASVIALFAGSTAIHGMEGVSGLQRKARVEYFQKLDYRFGYGSYVGTDGRVHVGIEKSPFVRPWKRTSPV